jgi:hypothetical protein
MTALGLVAEDVPLKSSASILVGSKTEDIVIMLPEAIDCVNII